MGWISHRAGFVPINCVSIVWIQLVVCCTMQTAIRHFMCQSSLQFVNIGQLLLGLLKSSRVFNHLYTLRFCSLYIVSDLRRQNGWSACIWDVWILCGKKSVSIVYSTIHYLRRKNGRQVNTRDPWRSTLTRRRFVDDYEFRSTHQLVWHCGVLWKDSRDCSEPRPKRHHWVADCIVLLRTCSAPQWNPRGLAHNARTGEADSKFIGWTRLWKLSAWYLWRRLLLRRQNLYTIFEQLSEFSILSVQPFFDCLGLFECL